jgi:hypothetical protein
VLLCLTVNCQSVVDVVLWRYTSVVSPDYSKGSLLVLRKHLFESISAIIFSNNEYFTVDRAQLWRLTSNRWQEFNLSLNAFVGTTEVYIIFTNFRQKTTDRSDTSRKPSSQKPMKYQPKVIYWLVTGSLTNHQ